MPYFLVKVLYSSFIYSAKSVAYVIRYDCWLVLTAFQIFLIISYLLCLFKPDSINTIEEIADESQPSKKQGFLHAKLTLVATLLIAFIPSVNQQNNWAARYWAGGLIPQAYAEDCNGQYAKALSLYKKSETARGWIDVPLNLRFDIERIVYFRNHGFTDAFRAMVCSGPLYRWNKSTITVYIPNGDKGFSTSTIQLIRDSLKQWQQVIKQPIEFKEIDNKDKADISFAPSNSVPTKLVSDAATIFNQPLDDHDNQIKVIRVAKPRTIVAPREDFMRSFFHQGRNLKSIYLHEIGHALGLSAHSIFADDIMFTSESETLSKRDIEAINRLYDKNAEKNIETILKKEAGQNNRYALTRLGELERTTGQYKKALDCFKLAADSGSIEAQEGLGRMYFYGEGISKDYSRAAELYRQSAEAGYPQAQWRLGSCYEKGNGVKKDFKQACKYYEMASNNALGIGIAHLARMYIRGSGVQKDLKKGFQLYQQAAADGDPEAEVSLGYLYETGQSTQKDLVKATYWYQKAADQEYAKGQVYLGKMYETGRGVQKSYEEALELYKRSASAENAYAQVCIGNMYSYGRGVDKNYKEAAYWYSRSAQSEDPSGQVHLAYCYRTGQGVTKNQSRAFELYKKAADSNFPLGQRCLALMYLDGCGTKKDISKAFALYKKAAEGGERDSQEQLGYMYESGLGVTKDQGAAINWFKKAAKQGSSYGQYKLGMCYLNGLGVEKNSNTARSWLIKAAEQGSLTAKDKLKKLN